MLTGSVRPIDPAPIDPAPVDPAPADPAPIDLALVAEILRRAGLGCPPPAAGATTITAHRHDTDGPRRPVTAGLTGNGQVFVRAAGSPEGRLLRAPEERDLAALVLLQALRAEPARPVGYDEARAGGVAQHVLWA